MAEYSKNVADHSKFRPLHYSDRSLPVPNDIFLIVLFDIKTTPLIRPLFGSPKGGLNIGILLYI